jgi:hypothetical protein
MTNFSLPVVFVPSMAVAKNSEIHQQIVLMTVAAPSVVAVYRRRNQRRR